VRHHRAVLADGVEHHGTLELRDDLAHDVDVLPDVELGPVRQREDADALVLVDAAVVDIPQLRALIARVPAVVAIAKRVDSLLGARFLLVAPGAAEGGVEAVLVERRQERLGLHHVRVLAATVLERIDARPAAFLVDVDDELDAELLAPG
jgi:hypothetical protein